MNFGILYVILSQEFCKIYKDKDKSLLRCDEYNNKGYQYLLPNFEMMYPILKELSLIILNGWKLEWDLKMCLNVHCLKLLNIEMDLTLNNLKMI